MHPAFHGIVDYAGLFPPASCRMDEAVAHYADYRLGPDREFLGRFVVAATRLSELGASIAAQGLLPGQGDAWELTVVFGANHVDELRRVREFEASAAAEGLVIRAVEAKVTAAGEVAVVASRLDPAWEVFLEVPHQPHYGDLIRAISEAHVGAKLRTGGTTPEAFPSARILTRFLMAVMRHSVPFKATAGLHHPWRGVYRLTYAPDSEVHVMHGFMNVLLAAALLADGGDGEMVERLLLEDDPSAFHREGDGFTWRGHRFSFDTLAAVRAGFRGFGSCSFREPVEELAVGAAS